MCINCDVVNYFRSQNVWIHWSRNLKVENECQIKMTEPFVNTGVRTDFLKEKFKSNDPRWKPIYCTWFSRGTWLYDPYHDEGCDDDNCFNGRTVVVIQNPKNILMVRTRADLDDFINKYVSVTDNRIHEKVNWDQIASEYAGVAFDFCKVEELGMNYQEAWWHCGFDVESLVLFHIQDAIGVDQYLIKLKF